MADTTTTAYGLTKPEVGASEDTWGTKINTDLDSLDTIVNAIGGKTAAGTLSYADSAKLVTSATGVGITGVLTSDGLTVDTNTLHVDATNNRVGIGTSSPDSLLDLDTGSAGATALTMQANGVTSARLQLGLGMFSTGFPAIVGTANGLDLGTSASAPTRFFTNSAEAARIDASGNLLVGTTSTTLTGNAGFTYQGGITTTSNNGSLSAIMNRNTNDGEIVQFRKDNSTVGSIGTNSSRLTIGNGDTGLLIAGDLDNITPFNTSTNASRDAAVDLGNSGVRFKDLYLSGGVYLGGTGSANKLSDVEEGDWTPTFGLSTTDPDSVVYNTAVTGGFYRKIGNYVFVSGVLYTSSVTIGSGAGTLLISNLPFVVANSSQGQNGYSSLYIGEAASFSGHHPSSGRFIQSNTAIDLFFRSSSNGGSLTNVGGDLNTGTNKNLLRFSGSYTTQ